MLGSGRSIREDREGLFSLPNLYEANDFLTLTRDAISKCNSLRQDIRNSLESQTLSPSETLHVLDEISNTVCSVIDASELCRSVHVSQKWRDAAGKAFQLLSEYIAELNADDALYKSLRPITSNASVMQSLTEEERRMATMLQKEFERDAIHLPHDERIEVQKLQGFVTQLESMFSENLVNHKAYDIEGPLVRDLFQIIPPHVLAGAIPQKPGSLTAPSQTATLSTEPHISNTLLKYSQSSDLRKQVYFETNTSCPNNLEVLDALIRQRHELAQKMGYPSYAHYFLSDKMASKPENVFHFLDNMRKISNDQYMRDMEVLTRAKAHVEGTNEPLEAWDLTFYSGLVKSNVFQGQDDVGEGSLAGYFTVNQSLEGMKILTKRLFGIVMTESEIKPSERWDLNDDESSNKSHAAGIRKFEFFQENDGKPLGTMYFDLHPRPDKYNHAAHFTVRCGCENRESGTSSELQYQLPIVALVCNFSPPSNGPEAILSHSEVETFFHEFGHGLHSLLSRTSFQHLSGTRTAMDFVETPSHLMEFYVWNKEFLNIIGRHYQTGSSIPDANIDNLVKSRHVFKSIEIRTQCAYAIFDQTIFGIPEKWIGTQGSNPTTTTNLFAAIHKDHNLLYVDGTHWHSKFGHLVTYGAGYYSYLYASIFSSDLWHKCFDNGSAALSRSAGDKYRNEILVHGGSKDPNDMLKNMLGREPKPDSFFQSLSMSVN